MHLNFYNNARIAFLALSSFFFLSCESGYAQDISLEQARQILSQAEPIAYPAAVISGCQDPQKKALLQKIFSQQLAAISTLTTSKNSDDAKLLIPFLNYSDSAIDNIMFPDGAKEDLVATCKAYPAFAALLSIPHSEAAIRSYCLNPENPADYRISAFLVLRYLDLNRFHQLFEKFDTEFKHSDPQVKTYLTAIENGTARFWGVVPITTQH